MTAFFGICPEDGCIEWLELFEDPYSRGEPRLNYLTREGKIHYQNDAPEKKQYDDVICTICEAPMVLISIDVVPIEKRMEIYKMTNEERILYAKKYLIMKKLQ